MAENEAIVEDVSCICLTVSHLYVCFAQTVPSFRIPEEYALIFLVSAQGLSFL